MWGKGGTPGLDHSAFVEEFINVFDYPDPPPPTHIGRQRRLITR